MVDIKRLEELCYEKHWSKRNLEREADIAVGSISRWSTVDPSTKNLKKVADALGVSTAYLTGESDHRTEQDALISKWTQKQPKGLADEVRRIEAGLRIPVLAVVPCGIPIEAVVMVDVDDWEEISEKLARTGKFFGLKAIGDSMLPRIQEGDTLIVRQQSDADSGNIVIARIDGKDACCKKLLKHKDGIVLQSFNIAYDPMFFPNDCDRVEIIGRVMENRQKL